MQTDHRGGCRTSISGTPVPEFASLLGRLLLLALLLMAALLVALPASAAAGGGGYDVDGGEEGRRKGAEIPRVAS